MTQMPLRVLLTFPICLLWLPAASQEIGEIESYSGKGKLYYTFSKDGASVERYLLSRQSFGNEDGSGYQGDINVVYTYYDGAFETRFISYAVHCFAVDPSGLTAMTYQGDDSKPLNSRFIVIDKSLRKPADADKDEYNLYWAVCNGAFQKFK